MNVRPAVVADAGQVLTVIRAAYVTEAQLNGDPHIPPLTETLDEVRAAIPQVLVAVDGPRVVGTVRVRVEGDRGVLGRLAVAPDRQGEGIGLRLLEAAEAAHPELREMALFTGAKSASNIAFYERHGYGGRRADGPLVHLVKRLA